MKQSDIDILVKTILEASDEVIIAGQEVVVTPKSIFKILNDITEIAKKTKD